MFRKYHYLTHDLNNSAQCYGLFDGENIVGFCAITHFPHPRNKKLKHCHRLVILPDYQGIGLGTKFLSAIAKRYKNEGFDFSITTSAKNLMKALNNRDEWLCQHYGHMGLITSKTGMKQLNKTSSNNRNTATFFYKGGK